MNIQTEAPTPIKQNTWSHRTIDNLDENMRCFVKAAVNQEPVFVLRAQDITAPVVVLFWAKLQERIRARMDAGLTMEQGVNEERRHYFLDDEPVYTDPKLDGAVRVAEEMATWPNRKLAD